MRPGYHPILSLPVRHILTEINDVIGNSVDSVFAAHCVSQQQKMMFSEDEKDGHTPESSCGCTDRPAQPRHHLYGRHCAAACSQTSKLRK